MKKLINLLLFLIIILLPSNAVFAEENVKEEQTTTVVSEINIPVYLFTQQGCSYCAHAKDFLNKSKEEIMPNIEIIEFDLRTNPEAFSKYVNFAKTYNVYSSTVAVPLTFIGNRVIQGYEPEALASAITECNDLGESCLNPLEKVEEFIQKNPDSNTTIETDSKMEIIGWTILGVILIGGILLIINKKL